MLLQPVKVVEKNMRFLFHNDHYDTGNPEKAKQVILSILHHVTDNHIFPALPLFSKCVHGPIDQEKEWIKPGYNIKVLMTWVQLLKLDSLALERLRKAICGKNGKNLDDVKFMSGKYILLNW